MPSVLKYDEFPEADRMLSERNLGGFLIQTNRQNTYIPFRCRLSSCPFLISRIL